METSTLAPAPAFSVLTVHEVAALFRIDRSHVYAAVKSGKLPAARFGKTIRVNRDDAVQWFYGRVA